jgi:hypothetical protein
MAEGSTVRRHECEEWRLLSVYFSRIRTLRADINNQPFPTDTRQPLANTATAAIDQRRLPFMPGLVPGIFSCTDYSG